MITWVFFWKMRWKNLIYCRLSTKKASSFHLYKIYWPLVGRNTKRSDIANYCLLLMSFLWKDWRAMSIVLLARNMSWLCPKYLLIIRLRSLRRTKIQDNRNSHPSQKRHISVLNSLQTYTLNLEFFPKEKAIISGQKISKTNQSSSVKDTPWLLSWMWIFMTIRTYLQLKTDF